MTRSHPPRPGINVVVSQSATGSPITYMARGKQYLVFQSVMDRWLEELIAVGL
jgi:hypothetical protein